MIVEHLLKHKIKYFGFLVVLFLTVSVTGFILKTEAETLPLFNYSFPFRRCPPASLKHLHRPLYIHPCFNIPADAVLTTSTPSVPAMATASSSDVTATSTPSDVTASTTEATSTEATSTLEASPAPQQAPSPQATDTPAL